MKERTKLIFKRIFSQEFVDKLEDDKIIDLSASLAFYTALSLAPLLVWTLMSFSLLGASFKAELISEVQSLIGGQAGETVKAIALSADKTPAFRDRAGFFGLLTLLISAGAIFGQLRSSLNTIFEVPDEKINPRSPSFLNTSLVFIERKIFNLGMVFTFVFVSLVSLLISSLISLSLRGSQAVVGQTVNLIFSMLIFTFLFTAIYYFLPQKRIRPKVAFLAGFMTAVLFSIGKSLIGLYLGQSAIASLYGAAGSLIILLMWVYYSSIIIFISAEVANEINKSRP